MSRRPAPVLAAGVYALVALGLCFVPLFDLLAYEFAWALGLAVAVVAPATAARMGGDRPGRVVAASVLALAPALAVGAANGLRVPACNPVVGLQWFALLPACSAAYGAVWGWATGQLAAAGRWRPWRRAAALVACSALPAAAALARLWAGPAVFSFDPLWGFFAGSLYDEDIAIDGRMLLFRAGTAAWALAVVAGVRAWRAPGRATWATALVALAAAAGWSEGVGRHAGYRVRGADLEGALPAVERRDGLAVHLPADVDPVTRAAVADEHALRLRAIGDRLAWTPSHVIDAWVFASADDKARLVGGRQTMFARPWRRAIYVHGLQIPHRTVAHELVHAVAADFGRGPLRLSCRAGLLVNMAWVEGLAEALSPQLGALDLDGWTRAMARRGLAPPVAAILGPAGFWSQAPARAYTVAGSFIAWLLATYGPEAVKQAYGAGDVEAAYGTSLATLVGRWQAHLDSQAPSAEEQALAAARFRTPSAFARPCVHEVARLAGELAHARGAARLPLARAWCRHQGSPPSARLGVAWELVAAGTDAGREEAAQTAAWVLGLPDPGVDLRADARLLEARLAELRGAAAAADRAYREVAGDPGDDPRRRRAWVGSWASALPPPAAATMQRYLAGGGGALAAAALMAEQAARPAAAPTWGYLLGRQLADAGEAAAAAAALEGAGAHPNPYLEAERQRLLGETLWRLGRHDDSRRHWRSLGLQAPSRAGRALAADWLARPTGS